MTLTDPTTTAFTAPAAPAHPLASLSPAEITAVHTIVSGLDGIDEATRFAYVGLEEAPKSEVLAWERGEGALPARRARVQLLNLRTAHSLDLVVSLATFVVDVAHDNWIELVAVAGAPLVVGLLWLGWFMWREPAVDRVGTGPLATA